MIGGGRGILFLKREMLGGKGKNQQDKALLKIFSVCKYQNLSTPYVLTASFSPVSLVQDLAYKILEAVKVRSLNIFYLNRELHTGLVSLSCVALNFLNLDV